MRRVPALMMCLAATTFAAVTGCSGGGGEVDGPAAAQPGKLAPKVVDVNALPECNVFMPPLDDGRVVITGPDGWKPMSQRSEYVAGFYPAGTGAAPPRVLIKVDPAPSGSPAGFTADEVDKFEAFIMPILDEELAERTVREPPRILVMGERPWARYVLERSYKRMPMDEQVLETVANGRIYRIELTVAHQPNRIEYRDHAYAIAANMEFPKTAAPADNGGGDESDLGNLLSGEGGAEAGEEKPGDEKVAGEGDKDQPADAGD